jgi:oxygen-independent coproporphyrinogen-3 oxidase
MNAMNHLMEKYNSAVPRYTSYPTVPFWNIQVPEQAQWKKLVKEKFDSSNEKEGISVYIHLPFCESLCTYCGCNTRITTNHKVETPYIQAILKEWFLYLELFGKMPRIKELHLGGGTPTFFNAMRLKQLIEAILSAAVLCDDAELSFEAHPNNTSDEHLKVLYQLGFRRISLGIQDFDEDVQQVVNRVQSYESVRYVTNKARAIGYTSVNYDLIYGLPLQTERSIKKTIEKVIQLHPDRIAFYSYAHVPWLKPGQRKFTEMDLPEGSTKRNLYEKGRAAFEEAGYVEIGMDHFSLPQDPLYISKKNGRLYRNFMGYTHHPVQLLIGLGASAISDTWTGLVQNEKKVEDYYKRIEQGRFPFFKGHVLSSQDLILRKHILNLMCKGETVLKADLQDEVTKQVMDRLKEMENDQLIERNSSEVKVTSLGQPFLRNICAAFDAKFHEQQHEKVLFSKAI